MLDETKTYTMEGVEYVLTLRDIDTDDGENYYAEFETDGMNDNNSNNNNNNNNKNENDNNIDEICSVGSNSNDELSEKHPEYTDQIQAYYPRWEEMIKGPIPGSVEILEELYQAGYQLAALSNWSAETFPKVLDRYEFFQWFDPIIVSGEFKVMKPDPEIYHIQHPDFDA